MTSIEAQAALFSLLADPTRLKLLRLLSQQRTGNALCVNALAFRLGVTQSAVSQHLKILKSTGLVRGERRGYRVHYIIDRKALAKAQEKISSALALEWNNTERNGQREEDIENG